MRVFLGFGDPQLGEPERGHVLAEAHRDRLRREGDRKTGELVAVARQADEGRELRHAAPREAVESVRGQRARQLAGAIGAEIHEHDDVAVGHRRAPAVVVDDRGGPDELVGLAARVGGREARLRAGAWWAARPSTMRSYASTTRSQR